MADLQCFSGRRKSSFSNSQVHFFHIHVSGHFTQMVWKSSQKVGIGTATTKDGKMIIVANYKPPGNIIGEFKDNVFEPLKK